MSRYRKFTTICCAAVIALGLAACGGGGGTTVTPPPPTPYETATAAIEMAATAEAAQAAYDAVKGDVTAAQGDMLQAKVDARIMALNMMARADEQKMALSDAAGMIDTSEEALSTQEGVNAARTAIAGLRQAIADAVDVDDKSMYETQLNNAVAAVDTAQGGIDTATRRTNQMTALSDASDALQAALAALSGSTPTQAQLDAANNALADLNMAIADGADLTDDEKAPYQHEAGNAATPIQTAQTAFDNAEDEATKAANAAMAATAAKLYPGINAPVGTDGSGNDDRFARYDTTNESTIEVFIGTGEAPGTAVPLSEDKKTTVATFHGWQGKRYAASPSGGGTYEAIVYSNVGKPKMGPKFNSGDSGEGVVGFALDTGSTDTVTMTAGLNEGDRIASPRFTHAAGDHTFELPDPNPGTQTTIPIPGSYYGVAGSYTCTPGTGACTVRKTSDGYEFVNVAAWTFTATNPDARVTEMADDAYASYGWWLHKPASGNWVASAFVDNKGTAPTALTGIHATLQGSATYMGGAAGKYALSSSTGGINDAGHFTARATLEADFNDDTISGTIDNFMGADGAARNWSVELKEAGLSDAGAIGSGTDAGGTAIGMGNTVWTIGETAAAAAGQWSGQLQEAGTANTVPEVATGTFYSTYGQDGKMVGAFGVNKQ